ncbi:ATP-grasp domain-containing protein [Chryseobacterium chendengshani]|uniref:hypothetical protein n=1 Tax=Chryseobacterium sp. LJ756 TaxID=2864113 RepID=UPI001C640A91|nr:hypothetical protein [Chryseobacterium sp. LJ756]MBW7675218.1 hypothetical protein [Chryseobacterium sp. LJ756]
MVLIFNSKQNYTIYKLYDLLIQYKIKFEVIDPSEIFSFSLEQDCDLLKSFSLNNKKYLIDSISCIFSTSSNLNLNINLDDCNYDEFNREDVLLFLNSEWRSINEFFAYIFRKVKYLSVPYDNENKLVTNEIAKEVGFKIPSSIITTNREKIKDYFSTNIVTNKFIAKRICGFLSGNTKSDTYFQHEGALLSILELNFFDNFLMPSTSQEIIEFEFEVKSVYINEEIFSVIKHKNIAIDMPYVLDDSIKLKINLLMKKIGLKFGTIDLLIDKNRNYYFLEVNPHGQYDTIEALGDFNVYNKILEFIYEKEKSIIWNSKEI